MDVASGVEEDELEALTPILGSLPPSLEVPQTVEVRDTRYLIKSPKMFKIRKSIL